MSNRRRPEHLSALLASLAGSCPQGPRRISSFSKPSSRKTARNCASSSFCPSRMRKVADSRRTSICTDFWSTHGRRRSARCARSFQDTGQCIPGTWSTTCPAAADAVLETLPAGRLGAGLSRPQPVRNKVKSGRAVVSHPPTRIGTSFSDTKRTTPTPRFVLAQDQPIAESKTGGILLPLKRRNYFSFCRSA